MAQDINNNKTEQCNIDIVRIAKRKICELCNDTGTVVLYDDFGIFIIDSGKCSCSQTY